MNDSSINSFLCDGQQAGRLNHASLFSGIGGFDLAANWIGWNNIFQVEIDNYCQKVLTKNFPNVKKYRDIREFDGKQYRGAIDIISGGFPCQPFSVAGKRKGKTDDRHLWPEMFRVICEIQPTWIVGENVSGIISMELDKVLDDLESENYSTQTFSIPASGVGAWHKRERIWIIANSADTRIKKMCKRKIDSYQSRNDANYNNKRLQKFEPQGKKQQSRTGLDRIPMCEISQTLDTSKAFLCRGDDGIPNRLDRIKGLGNAIVPQVAYEIFNVIQIADRQKREEKTINTVKYAER